MQRLASVAMLVASAAYTSAYVLAPSGFVGRQLVAVPETCARERSDAVVMKLFDHKRRAIRKDQKEWLATMAGIVERANLWDPENGPEPEFKVPKKPGSIRTAGHEEFEKHSGGLFAQVSQPGAKKIHWRKGRGVGAGQGTSCGYGMRGQNSRGGVRPGFAGGQTPLYRTAPKWPGRPMGNSHYYTKYALIKLEHLNEVPDNVSEVDYSTLVDNGIVTQVRTKMLGKRTRFTPFKVVGGSELTRKGLTVKAHAFTSSAVEAIEAAGGKCVLLSQTTDEALEIPQDA